MTQESKLLIVAGVILLALLGAISVASPRPAMGVPAAEANADSGSPSQGMASERGGPLVVELFTSQGCSSCPPADRLLSRLAEEVEGGEIIPLAFHVDYWNYIGWQDPFSSKDWSRRQQNYAAALGATRIYTPQLVVAGGADCVGSDADEVERLIAAAKRRGQRGAVEVALESQGQPASWQARLAAKFDGEGPLDLMLAIVENDLVTEVSRGENARRTLHNDFVVRRLEKVATVVDGRAGWHSGPRSLELEAGWKPGKLRVVAFLQDPGDLSIHGAASEPL
ncbi:MAG: DUF1223 domain-containing protein [Acidobacteriota bacterium]